MAQFMTADVNSYPTLTRQSNLRIGQAARRSTTRRVQPRLEKMVACTVSTATPATCRGMEFIREEITKLHAGVGVVGGTDSECILPGLVWSGAVDKARGGRTCPRSRSPCNPCPARRTRSSGTTAALPSETAHANHFGPNCKPEDRRRETHARISIQIWKRQGQGSPSNEASVTTQSQLTASTAESHSPTLFPVGKRITSFLMVSCGGKRV